MDKGKALAGNGGCMGEHLASTSVGENSVLQEQDSMGSGADVREAPLPPPLPKGASSEESLVFQPKPKRDNLQTSSSSPTSAWKRPNRETSSTSPRPLGTSPRLSLSKASSNTPTSSSPTLSSSSSSSPVALSSSNEPQTILQFLINREQEDGNDIDSSRKKPSGQKKSFEDQSPSLGGATAVSSPTEGEGGEHFFGGPGKDEDPRKTFPRSSSSDYSNPFGGEKLSSRKSLLYKSQSLKAGRSHKGIPTHLFQKKKKEKGSVRGGGETEQRGWKERFDEFGELDLVADQFYRRVDAQFRSFSPGLSDHCKEFHDAFVLYLLPNITPNNKRKMLLFTKYLIIITDLLDISRGESGAVLGGVEKIEKLEDIDLKWVVKAEAVWKSSQWVKVLFKTGQELKETLMESEIRELKELANEYLQFLKSTKEPIRRQILEKICFFLLEHLSTHSLDPCNLFVGLIPSEWALEKLFHPFPKPQRRSSKEGTLDGLFEEGWRRSQKRVREQRRLPEGGGNDRVKQKDQEHEVQEQNQEQVEQHQKQKEPEKEIKKQEELEKPEDSKKIQEKGEKQEQKREPKKDKRATKTKKPSPRKSKHRRQQSEQVPPPLDYKDFLQALTRWSSLKHSPDQVVHEVDSLLSLLSPSITCPARCYVAVNVSSFQKNREWFWNQEIESKFILFRLSEPLLPSDTAAQVFIDSLETKKAVVPVEELLYYNKEGQIISLEGERKSTSEYFRSPFSTFFEQIKGFMKDSVANFIKENGAKHDMSLSAKLNYKGLEELCRDRMIVENILESPNLIPDTLVPSFLEKVTNLSEDWMSKVPSMLFPPARLEDAFGEITNFFDNLPSAIENEIQGHLALILSRISTFKKRGADLKSGKLKNEMCWWWLDHIEKRVDEFLTELGYEHDALPDDYLNTRPSDMTSANANEALLGDIIGEEGQMDGKYGVEKLVEEIVGEVYKKVDSLKEEMEFMLEKKWIGLPLEVGWGGEGERDSGDEEGDVELVEGGEVMKRDHEYLVKMKEMDEKISEAKREGKMEKKQLELSDVVPVAGLVMARFHVKNCELGTAIGHWKKKEEMAWRKFRMGEDEAERKQKEGEFGFDEGAVGFLEFNVEGSEKVLEESGVSKFNAEEIRAELGLDKGAVGFLGFNSQDIYGNPFGRDLNKEV